MKRTISQYGFIQQISMNNYAGFSYDNQNVKMSWNWSCLIFNRKPPYRMFVSHTAVSHLPKNRCVFRYGSASAPEYHRQCGKPVTSLAGYDIPNVLPNPRTAHGFCFSQAISRFIVSAPGVLLPHRNNASHWNHARYVPLPAWRQPFLYRAVPA